MKKTVGVWIDHRKAVIVSANGDGEVLKQIDSHLEKHVRFGGGASGTNGSAEDQRDRQFTGHLNRYYEEVLTYLRAADAIYICGPGEAKGELAKQLEHAGLKAHIEAVEAMDKLTDRQISAKVRAHFQANASPTLMRHNQTLNL